MTTQWTPTFASQTGTPPSVGWMLSRSAWLLAVFAFGGWFAWAGFALIGALVIRVSWLIAAGIYAAASFGTLFVEGAMQGVLAGVIQTAAIIHGLILNRTFLITLWGRRERGERQIGRGVPRVVPSSNATLTAPVRVDAGIPAEAAALFDGRGTLQSDYLQQPASSPVVPIPPPAGTAAAAVRRGRRTHGLNVNTATAEQLAALPQMGPARAAFAVSARHRQPFTSTQHFAEVLGLQPHEFASLRDQITCTTSRTWRSTGRRLDL
ncbi:MAG: ComEA family DNA-binding protein [Rhodoglobus sp.]